MYTPPPFPRVTPVDPEEVLLHVLEEYEADQFRLKVGGSITITEPPPTTITDGNLVLSTVAAPLVASSTPCKAVLLYNSSASIIVYVGSATSQSFALMPHDRMTYPIDDAHKINAKSDSATPSLSYNILT